MQRSHADMVTPFRDNRERFRAGRFGMGLFLASLAVLFAASLIGYVVIRMQLDDWPTDLPPLPPELWGSTLLLVMSSVTMQWALNSARRGEQGPLCVGMVLTTIAALAFLALQLWCWTMWFDGVADRWDEAVEYRWALSSFYVLTGIHAAHVIGGVLPMFIVTIRAIAGRYHAAYYNGVHYCAMYWHFLGAVWVVLFLALLVGT